MTFTPILTVMPDFVGAPFLWIACASGVGIGGNIVDAEYWHEGYPMSKALWKRLAAWAVEFERALLWSPEHSDAQAFDWSAFHATGLQLARSLKAEVGNSYRVVYVKPFDDPNHRADERTEVLSDGALLPLPSHRTLHYPRGRASR